MDFMTSIKTVFRKYAVFNGRASRSEFWWFFLFSFIASLSLMFINEKLETAFQFLTLLPFLAVGSRRLHDMGMSGWWQLLSLTIIGIIPVLIWSAHPSEENTNVYGDKPLS